MSLHWCDRHYRGFLLELENGEDVEVAVTVQSVLV